MCLCVRPLPKECSQEAGCCTPRAWQAAWTPATARGVCTPGDTLSVLLFSAYCLHRTVCVILPFSPLRTVRNFVHLREGQSTLHAGDRNACRRGWDLPVHIARAVSVELLKYGFKFFVRCEELQLLQCPSRVFLRQWPTRSPWRVRTLSVSDSQRECRPSQQTPAQEGMMAFVCGSRTHSFVNQPRQTPATIRLLRSTGQAANVPRLSETTLWRPESLRIGRRGVSAI